MHIQQNTLSKLVEGVPDGSPVLLYEVPDRFKYKMTEITLTNEGGADTTILLQDIEGTDAVDELYLIIPAGASVSYTGLMRHFAKNMYATVPLGAGVTVSTSGYLC